MLACANAEEMLYFCCFGNISNYGKSLSLFALSSLCLSVLFSGFPSMEEEEEEEALTGEKEKRQIMERA